MKGEIGPSPWYACEEHIDILLDEIVDQWESAPTIDTCPSGETEGCNWCGRPPKYVLRIQP